MAYELEQITKDIVVAIINKTNDGSFKASTISDNGEQVAKLFHTVFEAVNTAGTVKYD
jgi:hypothetical protein